MVLLKCLPNMPNVAYFEPIETHIEMDEGLVLVQCVCPGI